jgi:Zn-dependent M28 family amino/carboxypeptidase
MPILSRRALTLLPLLLAAATAAEPVFTPSPARILARTSVLASDAFEGRGPGTRGEDMTVAYLEKECRAMGLAPGNPDGTYVQAVPLLGTVSQTRSILSLGDSSRVLVPNVDIVAPSQRPAAHQELKDSGLVFVGYGVTAPELDWDDYRGIDVKGKTVVMLINDPPVEDAQHPGELDPKVFGGKAMTYYGRWTYKYENAVAHGAAACLIVHETGPAAYPFSVVVESRSRENLRLNTPTGDAEHLIVEGWLSLEAATQLLAAEGRDFSALKAAAVRRDFRAVPLRSRLSFVVDNQVREVLSRNVIALLPGSDPYLKNEYVVLSAHWDHLGRDTSLKGDQIYNGAKDNASGVAQILEVAEGLLALPADQRPRRSILCLFPTSEEKSLLGAKYYAEHPLHPLERTLADLNVDSINVRGRTEDITVVGFGASTIEDLAAEIARGQDRVLVPEKHPEFGHYYRADHLEFARAGVPAFYLSGGSRYRGQPAEYAEQQVQDYVSHHYHKVADEVQPDWTMVGGAEDAAFLAQLALRIANGKDWPRWRDGNEFKAKRDSMLAKP